MALSGLLGFLTAGSSVGLMGLSAWLIAAAALHPSIADLQLAIVGVRAFGIARGVFRYVERLVSHDTTFRLLKRIRVWFYERLEPLAPARLVDRQSGDLLSRVLSDIDELENLYMHVVGPPLVALLTVAGMLVFVWFFGPQVALPLLAFYVLGGVVLPLLIGWLGSRAGRASVVARARLNAALVESLQGMGDLLAFNAAGRRASEVERLSRTLAHRQATLTRVEALKDSLLLLVTGGAVVGVLVAAIPRVQGVFLASIALAVLASFEAAASLPLAARHLGNTLEAAHRLFEITGESPAVLDPPHPAPAPSHFDLEVRHLSFRYGPDDPPVLQDVSFSLAEGERLAIVGASGAGKSTLVNLLLRFWDYEEGEILLGGRDLRQYRQDDVRAWIGVVTQRTHLFNATIRENLLIARPAATDGQIIAAAKAARIHDFIESLPDGYDTWIGEDGVRLSGGERQRLAIARVLLKDAPLLILDEAAANLDAITGRAVMAAIEAAMRGRTTLIITHRLAELSGVDRVLTLHEGRVITEEQHTTHR
ncbi:MAG TPA: thiol reductant ABC exporter subunit CydC [Chloroflexi bacterium]|nr:thiol reductant ABC exporter subunit CydC [Chloroflexota bacterium]